MTSFIPGGRCFRKATPPRSGARRTLPRTLENPKTTDCPDKPTPRAVVKVFQLCRRLLLAHTRLALAPAHRF